MGGKNVSCDIGGGGTYYRAPPPKPVLEASESGIRLVCTRFLWEKWVTAWTKGGQTYHRWGGQKRFLGAGPPLSFPPPFVFLWEICRDFSCEDLGGILQEGFAGTFSGRFKQGVSKEGVMTFARRPGWQHDAETTSNCTGKRLSRGTLIVLQQGVECWFAS